MTLLLAVVLAAAPSPSRAFGDAGTFVPSGEIGFSHSSGLTALFLEPSIQYFFVPQVAIGIGPRYTHSSSDSVGNFDALGATISLAVNVPAGDRLSLLPQVSFSAVHAWTSGTSGTIIISGNSSAIGLDLFVPLLFHPAQHVFLGIGPELSTAGPSSDLFQNQSFGVHTVIGAWL